MRYFRDISGGENSPKKYLRFLDFPQISGIVAIVDMEGFGWEHIMQVLYMKYRVFFSLVPP